MNEPIPNTPARTLWLRTLTPGVIVAASLAFSASFIAAEYGGPTMLYALLFGMAFHFLSDLPRYAAGIQWASRRILHVGVALLGARMGLDTFLALGWLPVVMVVTGVTATVCFGAWLARRLGQPFYFGVLSGGATAICGASAALAISAILPKHKDAETQTLFTIVGVTALSTLCMVLYPLLTALLGLEDATAGILIGGTIHDVAQVVGAGYMISDVAGDNATLVKLMRVAMLVPVCVVLASFVRKREATGGTEQKHAGIPWFLWAFMALAALASFQQIPPSLADGLSTLSRGCLITAICAIGLKTSLGKLRHFGLKPVLLIVGETLFLLGFVLLCLFINGVL